MKIINREEHKSKETQRPSHQDYGRSNKKKKKDA